MKPREKIMSRGPKKEAKEKKETKRRPVQPNRGLPVKFLGYVNAKGTLTKMHASENHGEFAVGLILLQTYEKRIQSYIFGPAKCLLS